MSPSLHFGLTKLVVPDLPAAERFYCDALGFRLVRHNRATDHAYQQEQAILALGEEPGGHALILVRYLNRPCPEPGAAWIGLTVVDAARSAEAVVAAGGRIEVPLRPTASRSPSSAIRPGT